jgi:hypothetical protein
MKLCVIPDGELVPDHSPSVSSKTLLEVDFNNVNRETTVVACNNMIERFISDDEFSGLSILNINLEVIDCLYEVFTEITGTYGVHMRNTNLTLHSIQTICSFLVHEECSVTYVSFIHLPDDATEHLGRHLHLTNLTGLCLQLCNVNRTLCEGIIESNKIIRLGFGDVPSFDIDAICDVVTRVPFMKNLALCSYNLQRTDLMKLCRAIQSARHFRMLELNHMNSALRQADIDCFVDVLRIHPSFSILDYAVDENDDNGICRTLQAVELIKFRYVILTLVSGIQHPRLGGGSTLRLLPIELIRELVTFFVSDQSDIEK